MVGGLGSTQEPPVLRVVLRPGAPAAAALLDVDRFCRRHLQAATTRATVVQAASEVIELLLSRSGAGGASEVIVDVGDRDVQLTGVSHGSGEAGYPDLGGTEIWTSIPLPAP